MRHGILQEGKPIGLDDQPGYPVGRVRLPNGSSHCLSPRFQCLRILCDVANAGAAIHKLYSDKAVNGCSISDEGGACSILFL